MNIAREDVAITDDGATSGVVVVASTRVFDDGTDMSTRFVVAKANAGWLADELEKADNAGGYAGVEQTLGDDALRVFGGGTDWQPRINVQTERGADPEAGTYAFAMTQPVAEKLRDLLRAAA